MGLAFPQGIVRVLVFPFNLIFYLKAYSVMNDTYLFPSFPFPACAFILLRVK